MKNPILILILLALGLAPVAVAQPNYVTVSHTLPAGYETVKAGSATGYPFNTTAALGHRWQWIYDWTQLAHQCPVEIVQIAFRPINDAAVIPAPTTLPGCTLRLSTLPASLDNLTPSAFFANNLSGGTTPGGWPETADPFFIGDITIPAYTGTGTGSGPAPFNLVIPFGGNGPFPPGVSPMPFFYDPTTKRDLVIDLQVPTCVASGFVANAAFTTFEGGRFGSITGASQPGTDWNNPDFCPIIEVTYTLGTSQTLPGGAFFELQAVTTVGSGDLNFGFLHVPATAVQGATLISFTPVATIAPPLGPIEFGRGPVFGIWPDLVTFDILGTPAAPGNIFRWTWPVSAPVFPAQGITVPPGGLSFLVGQTWEMVGAAVDAAGLITGLTAPVQINW